MYYNYIRLTNNTKMIDNFIRYKVYRKGSDKMSFKSEELFSCRNLAYKYAKMKGSEWGVERVFVIEGIILDEDSLRKMVKDHYGEYDFQFIDEDPEE